MGNKQAIDQVTDFNINWKVKRGTTTYDYYIDGNKVTCVKKSLLKSQVNTWILSDHKIEAVERNSDHILFLDAEGRVHIIKYGKPPARVKIPWKVKRIHSEQSLACDFSLLFCLKQGGLGDHRYHVICLIDSKSQLPRIRADQIAKAEGLNVAEFTSDTISDKGMLTKILDLGDNRAQVLSVDKVKSNLNMPQLLKEPEQPVNSVNNLTVTPDNTISDSPPNDRKSGYDQVIANLMNYTSFSQESDSDSRYDMMMGL